MCQSSATVVVPSESSRSRRRRRRLARSHVGTDEEGGRGDVGGRRDLEFGDMLLQHDHSTHRRREEEGEKEEEKEEKKEEPE